MEEENEPDDGYDPGRKRRICHGQRPWISSWAPGDARLHASKAMDHIAKGELDEAKAELKEADKTAGRGPTTVQTEMIQGDIRGGDEKMGYYVLFAHAQDTLMTIQVEINMTKSMLKIAKNYEKRLADLEAKVQG